MLFDISYATILFLSFAYPLLPKPRGNPGKIYRPFIAVVG